MVPFSTASPYSAIDVTSRPFAKSILNAGSALSSSPTTAVRATSTTSFAASMAACAWARETPGPVSLPSCCSAACTRASSDGSAAASCGFMASYSSAIGCVAWISAESASPSSRLSSSALKWPSASSRPPAKSAASCPETMAVAPDGASAASTLSMPESTAFIWELTLLAGEPLRIMERSSSRSITSTSPIKSPWPDCSNGPSRNS